jgi:hypothetical protein
MDMVTDMVWMAICGSKLLVMVMIFLMACVLMTMTPVETKMTILMALLTNDYC